MKVILLKDDKNLGKAGSLVEAKDGYARNFLLPRKVAIEANEENLKKWEEDNERKAEEEKKNRAEFTELKKKIEAGKVVIKAKAGEGGRLFGAITSQNIKEALESQMKIKLDKKKIELSENIKMEATKTVPVRLYPGIVANLKVIVEAE
ncbi:large subunit ribosomal protein L9 [Peptoniphilus asaccharolyticus DSM 20463]|uniref:Large ribosomal subunit protein bL9 n=1 Tax=Peptoniphilus asaccharolyticus DSM 20463 TaxID=573058 RepID=A0A1W1V534_PEPAS|nr:50S ribosomal protein L9 [Peptoniphilus asaccharolyticus]MBL7576349.1 50S ribosomal protein L9 [Peptoniphilus asaccharolyticus]SMB88458.1 large subunit ribosomal protein L9 [Peptoniphilus asaccharolyticus DSM 20463]